jgi:hypothetical protein
VAVIVVEPARSALTTPEDDTVAICGSPLLQSIVLVSVVPDEERATALSWTVSSTASVSAGGATMTVATASLPLSSTIRVVSQPAYVTAPTIDNLRATRLIAAERIQPSNDQGLFGGSTGMAPFIYQGAVAS